MSKPLKGFIAYSHENTTEKDTLRTYLAVMKQQNKLVTWHDGDITGGDKARQEDILKEVADSDILLYLVSATSLASKNCNKELAEALNFDIRVISIILEDCDWQNHQLSDFQALPDKGKPINEWQPESKGWQNVVDGIRKAVEEMQSQAKPSPHITQEDIDILAYLALQRGNFLLMLRQIDKAIEAYSRAIKLKPNYAEPYNNRGVTYGEKGNLNRAIVDYTKAIKLKPDYAEAYNNRGVAYGNKGDFDRAIVDYNKAIELKPDNAIAYYNRGVAYGNKGDFDRAIADYTTAVKLKPDDAIAYNNRGVAYDNKGDFDRAIEDFNTAIQLKPDLADAYNNRGVAYLKKGDFDRAIADYTTAVKLKPDDAIAYNNRGVAYDNKGDFDRAIADFNTAIQLKPDLADAYNNRGGVYDNKDEVERAIADYTKAIDLNPDYAEAHNNRGLAYNNKGNFDRAIVDFNTAIQLKPDLADAYNNRGGVYDNKDEVERAIVDYTKAIDLNPDYAEAYSNRGGVYYDKGEVDRAIADFNTAIQLKPDLADAYNNRGRAYEKKGDYDRAIADFNTAIQLKPDLADAYNNRGRAYEKKSDYDRAIADYTKAIDLKPDYAEVVYYNRGGIYYDKGDFDRAIEDFNTAIQLNPDDAEVYYNRGVAYNGKGDYVRAIEDCSKAIDLKPDYANAYSNRGAAYHNKGDFDRAIADYTKAMELKPDFAAAYSNRGAAYSSKGDFDHAIEDYDKAIERKPELAEAYYNRGEVRLRLKEWEKAKADLITAKEKGMDIVAAFRNDYRNTAAFERRNQVKLPKDIVSLVREGFRSRYPRKEKALNAEGKSFESPEVFNLVEKLRNAGTPLGKYLKVSPYFGVKTAPTQVFVVDRATRDELIAAHPSSADILKPFLHGRDIRRWQVEPQDQWLIFVHRGIEIDAYPAIRKHLEKYWESLSKRRGRGEWYELQASLGNPERFAQPKLVCPNLYNAQTFAVETDGFYCGYTCCIIPTEETWLCGLLNTRTVEWFYSQTSKQLGSGELQARNRYIKGIPVPDVDATQKDLVRKLVDYLIYLQKQPTTSSEDLAYANDFLMLKYFERIINGLFYEFYMPDVLRGADRDLFKHLMAEQLPEVAEIRGDKMPVFRDLYEHLYHRKHPVRVNLFFQDSLRPIRIIEDKW